MRIVSGNSFARGRLEVYTDDEEGIDGCGTLRSSMISDLKSRKIPAKKRID